MSQKLDPAMRRKLQDLPDKPGIYLMRDRRGKVIYIGKAVSLRKRVQSYFRRGTLRSADPKLRSLIHSVADLEVLPLRSDEEATITESRFVKEYRPRYNVLLKDDKRFPLLRIRRADAFPRFSLCRVAKPDGAEYFGPYTNSRAARTAMDFVERRYGLRRCRPECPGPHDHRHCHDAVLRFCSAPCIGQVSPEAYRERAGEACAFLRGERLDVLHALRAEMETASQALDFERAAALRDTLRDLHAVIRRRVRAAITPAMQALRAAAGAKELARELNLAGPAATIEAFDISHISGTLAVGSMVYMANGTPQRRHYRTFRIREAAAADDTRRMIEVLRRRYAGDTIAAPLPDLVLVDGGIAQVRAARRQLDALGLHALPVAGLAKRLEEIILPEHGAGESIRLPDDSAALAMVRCLRDEAHRFALAYHRRLRARKISESQLDDIHGIGPRRKHILLRHFGSLARLRAATPEALAGVKGIGPVWARRVLEALQEPRPASTPGTLTYPRPARGRGRRSR